MPPKNSRELRSLKDCPNIKIICWMKLFHGWGVSSGSDHDRCWWPSAVVFKKPRISWSKAKSILFSSYIFVHQQLSSTTSLPSSSAANQYRYRQYKQLKCDNHGIRNPQGRPLVWGIGKYVFPQLGQDSIAVMYQVGAKCRWHSSMQGPRLGRLHA